MLCSHSNPTTWVGFVLRRWFLEELDDLCGVHWSFRHRSYSTILLHQQMTMWDPTTSALLVER